MKLNIARLERLQGVGRVAPRSGAASQRSRQEQRRAQPLGLCHAVGFQSLLFAVPFGGFIVQELTDEIFEHHRGLREFQRIAAFQVDRVAAGRQTDVLLAEQARRQDLRGVGKKWLSMFRAARPEASLSKRMSRPADTTPALSPVPDLRSADVFELGVDRMIRAPRTRGSRPSTTGTGRADALMPNIPTHKSPLRASGSLQSSEHQCGQHGRREYRERRYHRAWSRPKPPRRSAGRRSPRKPRSRSRHAEHEALDDSVGVAKIHRCLHRRPERAFIDADQPHTDEVAAEHPHRGK